MIPKVGSLKRFLKIDKFILKDGKKTPSIMRNSASDEDTAINPVQNERIMNWYFKNFMPTNYTT